MQKNKLKLSEIKTLILGTIDTHEEYRNSYFWTGLYYRSKQFDRSYNIEYKGKKYEIEQSMTASRANVYYSLNVYIDGVKKDVRALKKVLKEIEK